MPFEVSVDTAAVRAKVDKIADNIGIARQNVPPEFLTWQVEDMKRKFPNMEMSGASSVTTRIWPRSRQGHIVVKRRYGRSSKPPTPTVRLSARPILRPELFDKLCARMRVLLHGILPWA